MNWRTQRPVGFALERPAAFLKVPIAIRPAIRPTTAEVPCRIWQSYTSSAKVSEGGSRVRQETRIARRKRGAPREKAQCRLRRLGSRRIRSRGGTSRWRRSGRNESQQTTAEGFKVNLSEAREGPRRKEGGTHWVDGRAGRDDGRVEKDGEDLFAKVHVEKDEDLFAADSRVL